VRQFVVIAITVFITVSEWIFLAFARAFKWQLTGDLSSEGRDFVINCLLINNCVIVSSFVYPPKIFNSLVRILFLTLEQGIAILTVAAAMTVDYFLLVDTCPHLRAT
jgi:hypothetical protein